MPPLTYPQTHHMKTPAEFERCYARKRSASDGLLIVYACENGLAHPRLGGSVGLWAFIGVTPFVRVGAVEDLGTFAEIGVHIALPVYRR